MKKVIPVLALSVLFFACKKNNNDVNPDEVRLIRTESENGGNTHKRNFEYDGSGRINKVTAQENNQAPTTLVTITYNGNEATLSESPMTGVGTTITNEVHLTLDAEKRVVKRTQYNYLEFGPPTSAPQRTYICDTTIYEYDATGLLKKTTNNNFDTTWFSPPAGVSTYAIRSVTIGNYTTTSNNLVAVNKLTNSQVITKPPVGGPINSSSSREENTTLQYNQSYSNSTDFSNAAILNEIELFSLSPLNKKYAGLPNKVTSTTIQRDQAGNITSTNNSTVDVTLGYNSYGFLSTVTQTGGMPVRFIYNH